MPIDYFQNKCKSSSSNPTFGLCDDPPPAENPAYIDEVNQNNWIAQVKNLTGHPCDFYAIDNCVIIQKKEDNTKQESRCDGVLHFNDNLIFVELKNRDGGK